MNKRFLFAALLVAVATAANGATAIYKIKNIDAAAHAVTLGNDQVYVFGSDVKLDGYKVGDLVRITFTNEAGKNTATAIVKQ